MSKRQGKTNMTMRSKPGAHSTLRDDERWEGLQATTRLIQKVLDRLDANTQAILTHQVHIRETLTEQKDDQTATRQIADLTATCEWQTQEIARLTRALDDASDKPPINLDDPSLKHMTKDDLLRRLNHLGDLYREAVMRERAQQDAADAMRRERDEARKERDEIASQLHVVLTTRDEAPIDWSGAKEWADQLAAAIAGSTEKYPYPEALIKARSLHTEIERLKTLVGEEDFPTAHNWQGCSRREAIRQAEATYDNLTRQLEIDRSLRSQVCEQRQQTQRLRVLLDEIGTRAQEGQE